MLIEVLYKNIMRLIFGSSMINVYFHPNAMPNSNVDKISFENIGEVEIRESYKFDNSQMFPFRTTNIQYISFEMMLIIF